MTDWTCPYCELQHTADVAKSMISVPDVLDLLGVEVDTSGKFTLRDERTPSCHAYDDHFWDFGAGEGGDIIDLVQKLAVDDDGNGPSYSKAISMLMHKAVKAGREPGDVEREPVRQLLDFGEQLAALGGCHLTEWNGIDVSDFDLIFYGRDILVPHKRDSAYYGVKVRGPNGKSSWPGSQFTANLYEPFGWRDMYRDEYCVILEGESDSWQAASALREAGYMAARGIDVFALPSGAGSWKDSWLADLEPYRKVVVVMDNDQAGRQARQKLESKIGAMRVKHLYVPQLANDVREAVNSLNWPVARAIFDAL